MGRFLTRLRRRVREGDEGSPGLRLWTALCVVTSVFAITAHEDFGALRFTIPALVVAGYLFSWTRRRRRNTWVKAGLSLGCLVAAWVFLRSLSQDPFHTSIPLTIFLLWLQTLHSYDLPHRRDLLFSLLTSVVLMAVAAAFSVDLSFGVYFLLYALAACIALVYNAAEAAAAAAAGAAGGREVSGPLVVAPLRGGEAAPAGGAVLGALLAVASLIFLLTPRLPGFFITTMPFTGRVPIAERLQGAIVNPAYPEETSDGSQLFNPNGYFGFGPSVDLRVRGRLNEAVVMRVRTTERRNWRGLVFDVYTGTGWRIDDHRVRRHTAIVPPIELVHGRDDVYAYRDRPRRLVQTFYIEREQPNVAFGVPRVEQIYLPADHVYVDRYSSVRLPFTLDPGLVYTVVSRPLDPDPEELRRGGRDFPAFILERYLQVPATLPPRVKSLAEEVTAGAATPYEAAQAVNRFLWTTYRYNLGIGPQRRPGDAVDYFLFEEREGYCEQFASAMAVMLRTVGIPARLVTGYTPGTANPLTGLLEVRNSDAHAWVEVFFPRVGWVEFEPTPSFPDPTLLGDPAVPVWGFQGFAGYIRTRLAAITPPLWLESLLAPVGKVFPWTVGTAVAAVLVLLLRPSLRRSRGLPPRDAVLSAYAFLLRVLARKGLKRGLSETPREFARRARQTLDWAEIDELSALVEEALFTPRGVTVDGAAAARRLEAVLATRPRHSSERSPVRRGE